MDGGRTMNDITFNEYKGWLEKYRENNDVREINIQNEIVKKLINNICTDLEVVYSDKKGPNTSKHDYFQYCGTYIGKKGEKKAVTPDLVIAKNWNWLNTKIYVDYRAVVEVKSPFLEQRIYDKDYKKYVGKIKNELRRHLSAKNNNKVILTDALKWEFYTKNELVPLKTFRLYDLLNNDDKWDWKKSEQDFTDLKEFLMKFLNKAD